MPDPAEDALEKAGYGYRDNPAPDPAEDALEKAGYCDNT
jgi:hypothetical protein